MTLPKNRNAPQWNRPKPELVKMAHDMLEGKDLPAEAVLEYSPTEIADALDQLVRLRQAIKFKKAIMDCLAEKVLKKGDPNAARVWNEMVTGQRPLAAVPKGGDLEDIYGDALEQMRKAGVDLSEFDTGKPESAGRKGTE